MNLANLTLCAAVLFGASTIFAAQAMSQEQPAGTCERASIYEFEGVAKRASQNKPSLTRQFSTLGLVAKRGGCAVKVTCYASRPGQGALDNMQSACDGLADQMLRTQLDRMQRNNPLALAAVRAWQATWLIQAAPAPSQSLAGKVHIELR